MRVDRATEFLRETKSRTEVKKWPGAEVSAATLTSKPLVTGELVKDTKQGNYPYPHSICTKLSQYCQSSRPSWSIRAAWVLPGEQKMSDHNWTTEIWIAYGKIQMPIGSHHWLPHGITPTNTSRLLIYMASSRVSEPERRSTFASLSLTSSESLR